MADRGMGRGLSAILSVSSPDASMALAAGRGLRELPIEAIVANPDQPRRHFAQDALQALADSIQERGVLQPVLVRPRPGGSYEIVAGERRWRAALLADLTTIPAIVQERDDAGTLEAALIENMAREDLNPVEEARAVAALVEELGLTREQVGKRVGRSRVAVSNLVRILDLPDEVLGLLESGELSEGHGRALLMAEDQGTRRRLAAAAVAGGWSVRVTEERAREANAASPGGRRARSVTHPDQAAAASDIADALGTLLGTEITVRPRGTGYKVELAVASVDEALELARRARHGA